MNSKILWYIWWLFMFAFFPHFLLVNKKVLVEERYRQFKMQLITSDLFASFATIIMLAKKIFLVKSNEKLNAKKTF
jgi:hypothetical protein